MYSILPNGEPVKFDPLPVGGIVGLFTSRPGFCFFHLVRLFWNQIFICVSVRFKDRARFSLSQTDKYLVVLNLFSRATNCSYVNAVLARLGFPPFDVSSGCNLWSESDRSSISQASMLSSSDSVWSPSAL